MKVEVEITTRLEGTKNQYYVLRVKNDGVFDGDKVHTSKNKNYLQKIADDYLKISS